MQVQCLDSPFKLQILQGNKNISLITQQMDIQFHCLCQEYAYTLISVNNYGTHRSSKCREHRAFHVEQSIPTTVYTTDRVGLQTDNISHRTFYELKYFLITLCSWKEINEFIICYFPGLFVFKQHPTCTWRFTWNFCSCSARRVPNQRKHQRRKIQLIENSIKHFCFK